MTRNEKLHWINGFEQGRKLRGMVVRVNPMNNIEVLIGDIVFTGAPYDELLDEIIRHYRSMA